MFVLLQNVTSGMGCLLTPAFYKQIKSINLMVLVISKQIKSINLMVLVISKQIKSINLMVLVISKQIKYINLMVLVISMKSSAFYAVCVHNGYHFTRTQIQFVDYEEPGRLQWKLVPRVGNYN